MNRRHLIVGGMVLVALVALRDPYLRQYMGGDAVFPAPWWQLFAGVVGLLLLAVAAISAWRRDERRALALLGTETVLVLVLCAVYLARDGRARFAEGLAGFGYVIPFVVALLIRFAILVATARTWLSARGPNPSGMTQ